MKLLEYQIKGVEALLQARYGLLINLPLGVGKSYILYGLIKKLRGPVFICTYRYVLYQHIHNIKENLPFYLPIHIKKSKDPIPKLERNFIILMTPEIMTKKALEICAQRYRIICLDESQFIKNPTSKRTTMALTICEMQPKAKKVLLTATPTPEHIGELQPQMQCIHTSILGRGKEFRRRYERKRLSGGFWKPYYINEDEIKKRAAPYIFTYPEDKLPLPDQPVKKIFLDMPQNLRRSYDEFKKTCILTIPGDELIKIIMTNNLYIKFLQICAGFIIDTKRSMIMGDLVHYKLCDFKAKLIKDMCKDIDCSILIWGSFREELKMIHKLISDSKLIIGGVKKGDEIIQDFKDQKFKILIAHPKCIGAGISLEVAGAQIVSSISASALDYIQSEGRTRRISQMQNVTRHELIYKNTLEEKVFRKVGKKIQNQEELLHDICREEFCNK